VAGVVVTYTACNKMEFSTGQIVSVTEANQNFSAVARKVDACGRVFVFRNNRPAYVLYGMEACPLDLTDDERIDVAMRRVLKRYRAAFEELST